MNDPEILERSMYRFAAPDANRPVIEQDNDIDAPFTSENPNGAIPADLMALVHAKPSVDPVPEEVESVELKLNAELINMANPNSRFTIVDSPVLAPGTCILCKSPGGDGRQFIDLAIQITWVGALYFCTFCVTEAAKLIGLTVSQEAFDGMQKGYRDEVESGDDRWVEAQRENDALKLLLRNHFNGDCGTVTFAISEPESVGETSDGRTSDPVGESETPDRPEQNADESAPVEGPDDVSAVASNAKRPAIRKSRPGSSAK